MFLKVHHSPGTGDIVAVCDRELLNTTIRHGELSIQVSEWFYGNCPASEEVVAEALKKAGSINLMGKRAVRIAIELGFVTQSGCIMIGEIPHAQVYSL
ncbi:MAG TPA: DUF424 domain-containing protein [Methanoregula sp.]|nr:DUF424 domain-containing protein [Methanoregula sp.]